MLELIDYEKLGLADIRDKVMNNERLGTKDALKLFNCHDPAAVGALAHHKRTAMHGKTTYYVINQHINYTNVCVNGCAFCAYQRKEGESGGFTLSVDDILDKIRNNPVPPREIHIVGGCHPKLPLSYFCEALSGIREMLPKAVLKCFTAVEIQHFADLEGITTGEVLEQLKKNGLDMLPGGGAEIFAPDIRKKICPNKISADRWLEIHEQAHSLGVKSNCTMLFGHLESIEDRVDHLVRMRETQDKSGGFVCFIPLPFQTENSALEVKNPLCGAEELKTIAISRLMLDNIPHVKAYWIMLTVKGAQAALCFGAGRFRRHSGGGKDRAHGREPSPMPP